MKFEYSFHWQKQKRFRPEITDDLIEYSILNSAKVNDRDWSDAYNSIARVPPSGRILKVVYKEKSKVIKIITAYWID